jgi:hypothetical protein
MWAKCGQKHLVEQNSVKYNWKSRADQLFLEPPVGFEPTTFALQDQKEA